MRRTAVSREILTMRLKEAAERWLPGWKVDPDAGGTAAWCERGDIAEGFTQDKDEGMDGLSAK